MTIDTENATGHICGISEYDIDRFVEICKENKTDAWREDEKDYQITLTGKRKNVVHAVVIIARELKKQREQRNGGE